MRTRNNKKLLLASTVHIPTTTHPTPHRWGWWGVPVVTAEGKRPDPSRTRKLSPPAPMVLRPTGRGRVGHRRNTRPPPHPHNPHTKPTMGRTPAGACPFRMPPGGPPWRRIRRRVLGGADLPTAAPPTRGAGPRRARIRVGGAQRRIADAVDRGAGPVSPAGVASAPGVPGDGKAGGRR